MARRDLRDAKIYLRDGTTPTPLEIEVLIGTGNVTWSENTPMEYETEKGSVVNGSVRRADDVPTELSITAKWIDVLSVSGDGEGITLYELLNGVGEAAAAVSTGGDDCEPYAVDIEVVFLPQCVTKNAESIIFSEFRNETLAFDPQAGTLAITGKAKEVRPTYARPDAPVNSVAAAITGTKEVGETLSVTNGTWTGGGAFVSRQWYRNADATDAAADDGNVAISGATGATYVLQAGDLNMYIVVKTTFTSKYGTTTALSNVTTIINA